MIYVKIFVTVDCGAGQSGYKHSKPKSIHTFLLYQQ